MARGLLEDDHEWRICLEEAIAIQPGMAYCQLLAVILLTDKVAEPHLYWDQFKARLCNDIKHKLHYMNHYQANQEVPEDDIYNYCHDLAKWLSHYLYSFFSFSFGLTIQGRSIGKCHITVSHITSHIRKSQVMSYDASHDRCGKIVYRLCSSCISSVQGIEEDSIKFSLSTWT